MTKNETPRHSVWEYRENVFRGLTIQSGGLTVAVGDLSELLVGSDGRGDQALIVGENGNRCRGVPGSPLIGEPDGELLIVGECGNAEESNSGGDDGQGGEEFHIIDFLVCC